MVLVNIFMNLAIVAFGIGILAMLAGWFSVWRKHPVAGTCFDLMVDAFKTTMAFEALAIVGLLFV